MMPASHSASVVPVSSQRCTDAVEAESSCLCLRRGEKHEEAECKDESKPKKAEACGSPHGY